MEHTFFQSVFSTQFVMLECFDGHFFTHSLQLFQNNQRLNGVIAQFNSLQAPSSARVHLALADVSRSLAGTRD
jgi:hypothetical protein